MWDDAYEAPLEEGESQLPSQRGLQDYECPHCNCIIGWDELEELIDETQRMLRCPECGKHFESE